MVPAADHRTSRPQRAALRVVVMSLGAAALYGSWAVAVNWAHGPDAVVRAGATQVAYSVTVTAVMSSLIEALFARLRPGRARIWLTAAISTIIGLSVLVVVHILAGTPELLMTVLPSACIGTLYGVAYSVNLGRAESG